MRHVDLCVIGSGSGNSIVDERFADRRVAIVDAGVGPQQAFGGTCLNLGCIPTKMYVYPADLAAEVDHARALGVDLRLDGVHWRAIRDRIFGRIDPIAEAGRRWRASGMANVELLRGRAHFVGPRALRVVGAEGAAEDLTADQVVIAAGSRPRSVDVPGADRVVLHTSDTVMRLEELPREMVIVGGGYIGLEFAHVFASFGVDVTILNRAGMLLRKEDEDVALRATQVASQRCHVHLQQHLDAFEPLDGGRIRVRATGPSGPRAYDTDLVLVAIGRIPNGDRLGVEATGLTLTPDGRIPVDEHQRTPVEGIWALGDVSSPYLLKHVANAEARTVQHNLLHPDDLVATDHRFVPHAVFGSPQIAATGLTEQEARGRGLRYITATQDYRDVAYGWAMEDDGHFCKLLADPATGQLLGAHIIGPQASVLLQPLVQAAALGLDLRTLARSQYWIHPALTEVVENALLALPWPEAA
ncbi:mycothione reductase [Raineyella fluvialis]|uniref:Mycothione reductase n=1 Tax=Raineyella fluvialis TaxID=2662261 RepID=A0A5Q2FAL6_9ACTN|nr:mycothione reductase [Raineyella fluvialis]QGF23962.1 mycothione reductase [Raineyella fluvialis]